MLVPLSWCGLSILPFCGLVNSCSSRASPARSPQVCSVSNSPHNRVRRRLAVSASTQLPGYCVRQPCQNTRRQSEPGRPAPRPIPSEELGSLSSRVQLRPCSSRRWKLPQSMEAASKPARRSLPVCSSRRMMDSDASGLHASIFLRCLVRVGVGVGVKVGVWGRGWCRG